MEHYNKHNKQNAMQQQQPTTTTTTVAATTTTTTAKTTFEYTLPTQESDEVESNQSTPYFTPLDFVNSTFDFPSPKLEKFEQQYSLPASTNEADNIQAMLADEKATTTIEQMTKTKSFNFATPTRQYPGSSPALTRKVRRFSLFERRSCSPAPPPPPPPLLANRTLSCVENTNNTPSDTADGFVDDKENTKPVYSAAKDDNNLKTYHNTSSEHNSPNALLEDTSTNSPKIIAASNEVPPLIGGNRLTAAYSPKLLNSINNLNLGGSPLNVISSAGYKNGNYFKFPEIDHVVQAQAQQEQQATIVEPQTEVGTANIDNQLRSNRQKALHKLGHSSPVLPTVYTKSRFKTTSSFDADLATAAMSAAGVNVERVTAAATLRQNSHDTGSKSSGRKSLKNKNNLTIKITDIPNNDIAPTSMPPSSSSSPSPKPKTPTIKSTKEKALSLDSAAKESEVTIILTHRKDSHASCDEIDAQTFRRTLHTLLPNESPHHQQQQHQQQTQTQTHQILHHSQLNAATYSNICNFTAAANKPLTNSARTRRRTPGLTNNDWLLFHRKQFPFNQSSVETAELKIPTSVEISDVLEDDELSVHERTSYLKSSNSLSTPAHRSLHGKQHPLLHASNTNLKTLPEFVTLVEFSNSAAATKEHEHPYKQKSMDLPSCTLSSATHSPAGLRPKNITQSTSSTNLLQRRGSNHSLTLNLHGSCSNLLGNCRTSGLSVSNYSLGSVGNSTNNLNSKSSCNLELTTLNTTPHQLTITPQSHATTTTTTTSQGARQSLFRRRGSNHSLTLNNLSAASYGSLNSYASQNTLNVDRAAQQLPQTGVTRTASFVTPTNTSTNTVSHTTTPKRGLLERRGSNQSLTLNMSSSFGGFGMERDRCSNFGASNSHLGGSTSMEPMALDTQDLCLQAIHQRKFLSSESLNKSNTQFSDLNQAHRRDANQICFGSVSDLKPSELVAKLESHPTRRDHFDFQESTVCTCTGMRNIMTRPLSPQTTSEEFKVYLANIQLLQNASNALSQIDLIKLNYIFDNSYTSNSKDIVNESLPVLGLHPCSNNQCDKDVETPPALHATSEDNEVAMRYQQVVAAVLERVQPDEQEQKRIFSELHKEFWDLPLNHQEKAMVVGSHTKNRYKTILPNENSRVILEKEFQPSQELKVDQAAETSKTETRKMSKMLSISDETPYINANYIKGPDFTSKCYIATQGPLPNTIFEFWLMIYQNTQKYIKKSALSCSSPLLKGKDMQQLQQYYQKIVMLTNFLESNRQKCAIYFPVELNEVFITTSKHESLTLTETLLHFFQPYLKTVETPTRTHDADTSAGDYMQQICTQSFQVAVDEKIQAILPKSPIGFFVIKNVGIVKKNGFSIRKLVLLYCIHTTAQKNCEHGQLLMQRFYCYHYWYPDWPDHRSPRDINTLLDMSLHILNLGKCEQEFEYLSDSIATPKTYLQAQNVQLFQQDIFNVVQPLPIIHCSAGIGRTGCLTAILNGVRQIRQSLAYSLTSMAAAASKTSDAGAPQNLSPVDFCLPLYFLEEAQKHQMECCSDTDSSFTRNTLLYVEYILKRHKKIASTEELPTAFFWQLPCLTELPKMPDIFVDILGIVCNLRLQRGGMVQNSEQYELIHRAVCLYLKRTFALKRF